MNTSRTINLNTLSQFLGKGMALVFTAGTTFFLRRLLGREGFGDYIFIFSIVMLLVTLADYGTHLVSVKETAQKDKNQSAVLGNVVILRLFVSLLAGFLGFAGWRLFFQKQELAYFSLLVFFLIILISLKKTLLVIFHAKLKIYLASLQDILASFLLFLIALILFFQKGSLTTYIFLASLAYLLLNLPFSLLAWRIGRPKLKLDRPLIGRLISQSLPLGTILILYTVYSRLDTVILKLFWGSGSVGIYGLAYKIYENLVLPAAFFMNSLLPLLTRKLAKADKKSAALLLQKAAALLFFGSLLVALTVFLTGPLMVRILTGSYSWPEIISLWLLALALPWAYLNHLTGYAIIALSRTKKSLLVSVKALLFNLTANLIFVPLFNYQASALITVLTEAMVLWLSLKVVGQSLGFRLDYLGWPKIAYQFIRTKGRIFDND